jgi:hypothetical protein
MRDYEDRAVLAQVGRPTKAELVDRALVRSMAERDRALRIRNNQVQASRRANQLLMHELELICRGVPTVADFHPTPITDAGGFCDVWGDAR